MKKRDTDDKYSDAETARRRDKVVRRMANTPPHPKPNLHPEKKKKADADRAARKDRAPREG